MDTKKMYATGTHKTAFGEKHVTMPHNLNCQTGLGFLFALFVLPVPLAAQGTSEQVKLDDVVVSATREVSVKDIPASISVITAQDLENMGAKNIGDALVRIPGVYDDGASKYYLSVRGTRSSMSGGPLILVDGVPQDLGKHGYNNYETIPVSDIERIEVLRSPGTTAFGADSARGVISITTKSGRDRALGGNVNTSYGSWDTWNSSATLNGGFNNWDYFLNASVYDTGGFLHDDQTRYGLRFKTNYHFNDSNSIGLNFGYADNDYKTVRGKNRYALENDRRADEFIKSPGGELVSYNEMDQQVFSNAITYRYQGENAFLKGMAAATYYDELSNHRYQIYSDSKNVYREDRDQSRYKIDVSGGYHLGDGFFKYTPTLGINMEFTSFENIREYPYDPTGKIASKRMADMEFDQDKVGIFLQNQMFFGDQFELNFGIRFDDVSYKVENHAGDRVDTSSTKYPWAIAPAYHWSDKATTYISVGKSYWYPTPGYYQAAMESMNPENLPENLKPEESITYEIGHKHRLTDWANINMTLFYMEYKDKYGLFYDSEQKYAGYKNTGDSKHIGIELEVDGMLNDFFGYRLAGNYMKAEWTSGKERVYTWDTPTSRDFRDLDGYKLNRVPEYKYMVGLDFFPIEHLRCNIDLNVTGSYYIDYLNRIEYGGRETVDIGIRYERETWSMWMIGKNIFNEHIESVYNSNGQLNIGSEEISLNGLYNNEYHPRNGMYIEIGASFRF